MLAYLLLILDYWRSGPLADDDVVLASVVRLDRRVWAKHRPVIGRFFIIDAGLWRHKRIDAELVKWAEKRARAIERASAGGKAKAAKKDASSSAISNLSSIENHAEKAAHHHHHRKVEGPPGLSTLSGGKISFLEIRKAENPAAWEADLAQATADLAHFTGITPDPDLASEIAEFIDAAVAKLKAMEKAA